MNVDKNPVRIWSVAVLRMSVVSVVLMSVLSAVLFASCRPMADYKVYQYDNGDDYYCDGLRRIVDREGKIGFEDEKGRVAIPPEFAFAFPFDGGIAKATLSGHSVAEGEYHRWESDEWFYINCDGKRISERETLEALLRNYVEGMDARIGVAVIIDGRDTVAVNGNRDFPMLSVYKFPQALAVADYAERNGVSLNDTLAIAAEEIQPDTWSPMREHYGGGKPLRLPVAELLGYSLALSDNNACDILFRLVGGPQVCDSVMKRLGFGEITIASTEDEMHKDTYLCYLNRSTPIEMARLFDHFCRGGLMHGNAFTEKIEEILSSVKTGENRLAGPLKDIGARFMHKTGTGDRNSQGRIIGVNDAGYVELPDGRSYSIAVFIADSAYDMAVTESMIADISEIVYGVVSSRIAKKQTTRWLSDNKIAQ